MHCPPGGFERCPRPARKALHRQYGEILLGCGAPSALAARHLLQAAHPGDPTSLAGLDRASARTLHQSPQTAADLAVRALELTPPADQDALPRLVAAAETLTAAGRLEQAARIVHDALGRPLPPIQEVRLRCVLSSVLCTSGLAQDAVARPASSSPSRTFPANWSARRSSRGFRRWPGDRPTRGPTGWRTPPWPPPASPATR